jgi:hypothetical protein
LAELEFELRVRLARQVLLPLEPLPPVLVIFLFEIGSTELFLKGWIQTATLLDLCLLSS